MPTDHSMQQSIAIAFGNRMGSCYLRFMISLTISLILSSVPRAALAPDGASVASFADEEIPKIIEKHHLAGMTVAFVSGGHVTFAKGYGVRDRGLMVEADRTLFRAGSVSKLFVWT